MRYSSKVRYSANVLRKLSSNRVPARSPYKLWVVADMFAKGRVLSLHAVDFPIAHRIQSIPKMSCYSEVLSASRQFLSC